MAGGHNIFFDHGRTVMNGAHQSSHTSRSTSRSSSRSSGSSRSDSLNDDYDSSRSRSYREPSGISIANGHRVRELTPSRHRSSSSRAVVSSGIYPSNHPRQLTEGVSFANGHRVRVVSPNEYIQRRLRNLTMDELNQEYARICERGMAPNLGYSGSAATAMEQYTSAVISELRSRGASSRRFEY